MATLPGFSLAAGLAATLAGAVVLLDVPDCELLLDDALLTFDAGALDAVDEPLKVQELIDEAIGEEDELLDGALTLAVEDTSDFDRSLLLLDEADALGLKDEFADDSFEASVEDEPLVKPSDVRNAPIPDDSEEATDGAGGADDATASGATLEPGL